MKSLEQTDTKLVRELLDVGGPCITIALAGNETGDTAIELKDSIQAIQGELDRRGVDAAALLDPLIAEGERERGNTRSRGALILLRSPELMQVYRVPSARPVARVDDHFDLRTLLAIAASRKSFYILALSQNRTRILKCTQDDSEEVPFPGGYAVNLADFLQTRKPDHNLDNRATGGVSMGTGGVVFGTSSDREKKDEYMRNFFTQIDRGVNALLKDSSDPLVIAGVEHEIATYRRSNTYAHLVEPGVHGAPDGMDGGEMHRRALELLNQRSGEPFVDAEEFDKRVGTGHASMRIPEIVQAAYEGRVSHLFLQEGAHYTGVFDAVRQRVKHTEDPLDSPVDLVETAAWETIRQGGEVRMLPGSAMPNGVPVCALMRYPAVQNTASETVESAI
jgi:hypothetical protein